MKICSKCVLPESFPGLILNQDGICQYCQKDPGGQNLQSRKLRYRRKFEALVGRYRDRSQQAAVVSYSGGKDSSYVLTLMRREFGLNVLAVTFDNGFMPDQAFRNIRSVVGSLGLEHLFIRPPFESMKRLFVGCAERPVFPPATLTRASTICTACMALIKFSMLRVAIERRIPFMIFGWSPGQIPLASSIVKDTSPMIRLRQRALSGPIISLVGSETEELFLQEEHFRRSDDFPYSVSPLAFLDYDEDDIIKEISGLGWRAPADVDSNSSNCLLNSYANIVHKGRHGFHPYAFELAKLVREGYLERGRALAKLAELEKPETIRRVKQKLGLDQA